VTRGRERKGERSSNYERRRDEVILKGVINIVIISIACRRLCFCAPTPLLVYDSNDDVIITHRRSRMCFNATKSRRYSTPHTKTALSTLSLLYVEATVLSRFLYSYDHSRKTECCCPVVIGIVNYIADAPSRVLKHHR